MADVRARPFILLLIVPLAAIAQDRAPLKTCDRSREAVAVIEDTAASAARLKEAGLASGITPVVHDVLRRSGCFAQDLNASFRFQMSVTSISTDPVIVVRTSVRMANNEWTFEANGQGQAKAGPARADAYAAALTSAVEDAVNNLIEVRDRATGH